MLGKQLLRNVLFITVVWWCTTGFLAASTVGERLANIKSILIPEDARTVCLTVGEEIRDKLSPGARILRTDVQADAGDAGTLEISVMDTLPTGDDSPEGPGNSFMYFRIREDGPLELIASKPHLLFALSCLVSEDWIGEAASRFADGVRIDPAFDQIIGEDGFYGLWRRFSVGYDPDSAVRESARIGASHIVVNVLPSSSAHEDGPAGEIYYRFYQYLPDMDQYVETRLNAGTYPPEYLKANLTFLKEQAGRAIRHGLTPGMHVANPRSVPESLLQKYPYLRGPRVDHTFRSYRPRYTLTLAHPLARWHYATLLQKLLAEVPQIGFLTILVNDSGSGFEYTESLYPGRNGGPYLVREWQPDSMIARKAAELIIRYYRTLRDAARELNPDFRIHTGLNNVKEEKGIIYDGLDNGLDRLVRTQRMDIEENRRLNESLEARGSYRIGHASAEGNPYIIGVPAPWKVFHTLQAEKAAGTSRLEVDYDPPSLAPYDPNREVLRAFQFGEDADVDELVGQIAARMAGKEHAAPLAEIWKLTDLAATSAPVLPLYGHLGFAWYRFWVRPFAPDIEAIPVKDRAYYEDYMLTIFNNPHNIDLAADALWEIHGREQCEGFLRAFDEKTLPLIEAALEATRERLEGISRSDAAHAVFADLEARIRAYRCYSITLRNISAWIVGVHGYLDAETRAEKERFLNITREMVRSELANTKDLLGLWKGTNVSFMPVNESGEWMHDYGPNFGVLLERKIALMEEYGDRLPRIDPDYMWRLPHPDEVELAPGVTPAEYLQY